MKDISLSTAAAVFVGALVTVSIVGALIYLAVATQDHDAKLALIAMVSGTSTGASLVVLNRSSKTVASEISTLEPAPAQPAA